MGSEVVEDEQLCAGEFVDEAWEAAVETGERQILEQARHAAHGVRNNRAVLLGNHIRRSQRSGHITVNEQMPKSHQGYVNRTPHTFGREAAKLGNNTAIFIERLLSNRPHRNYRSAQGVLSLARRYRSDRLEPPQNLLSMKGGNFGRRGGSLPAEARRVVPPEGEGSLF